MATTISKQQTLNQLLKEDRLASPRFEEELPILEQFIFGLCRENATMDQARMAYGNLQKMFFDWNEVRVSSVREIEEALAGLSDAESRAQRVISFLQEVFENHFSFDLEKLRKEGVKGAAKQITKLGAASEYVTSWVVQRTLGGHAIPLDTATLRCTKRLGLLDEHLEDLESARTNLEHAIQKTKGMAFTDAISNLAEQNCREGEPSCGGCPMATVCPSKVDVGVETRVEIQVAITQEETVTNVTRGKSR
jgi:endonuclease-3